MTKAVKDYELFPERGVWKDGWRTVKVAIDERGRATFYDLFHTHAKFKRCDECPHKWWESRCWHGVQDGTFRTSNEMIGFWWLLNALMEITP